MSGPAWLILPTFNEAENIEAIVAAAGAQLAAAAGRGRVSGRRTWPAFAMPWPTGRAG